MVTRSARWVWEVDDGGAGVLEMAGDARTLTMRKFESTLTSLTSMPVSGAKRISFSCGYCGRCV